MADSLGRYVVGVDLGGTKLRVALADRDGTIVRHRVVPTLADEGRNTVIRRVVAEIRTILEPEPLTALARTAIAVPGPVDPWVGIVYRPPNLPGWGDVPLQSIVATELTVPVLVGNDANLAALAEFRFGAGRGLTHLVYVTVSTGVGGGVMNAGKLLLGAWGGAAEIGHMTIDLNGPRCGCGNHGCLEAMASGTAIAREAALRIATGEASSLGGSTDGTLGQLSAGAVVRAASDGDALARQVVEWAAYNLGVGFANIMHLYDPQAIIVGGGVANHAWDLLIPVVERAIRERAMEAYARRTRIVRSQLGDDVGVIGAVALALHGMEVIQQRATICHSEPPRGISDSRGPGSEIPRSRSE